MLGWRDNRWPFSRMGLSPIVQRHSLRRGGMEENLKTLRMLHQTLMLICLAIAAFALTPDPSTTYGRAIWELNTLRRLGIRSYALAASSGFPNEDKELAGDIRKRLGLSSDPKVYRAIYCEWPGDKASVNEYLSFLDTEQTIAFLSVNTDDLLDLYRLAVRRYVREYGQKPQTLTLVRFCPDPHNIPQLHLTEDIPLILDPGLKVNDPHLTLDEKIEASDPSYEMHVSFGFPVEHRDTVSIEYEEITGKSTTTTMPFHPKQWLQSADQGKRLSLIGLRGVAGQVGTMSLAEAAQSLQTKIESANREITVGGVAIDSRLVSWSAPLAIAWLLLYFLLHLSHLRIIAGSDQVVLCSFPWIGLFPGIFARLFAASSLILFPSAAIFLVFRRFDLHGIIPHLVVLAVLAIGLACSVYLIALQKNCRNFKNVL